MSGPAVQRAVCVVALVLSCGGGEGQAPVPSPVPSPALEEPAALPVSHPARQATSPLVHPPDPAVQRALAAMEAALLAHARAPDQPWVLDHALLAFGAELRLPDDRRAVGALVAWAEPERGGLALPRAVGEVRVSPHADLVLKTLIEVGWSGPAVDALLLASLKRPWAAHDRPAETWDDAAWTAFAWALALAPDAAWTTADGRRVSLPAMRAGLIGELIAADAPVRAARDEHRQLVKDKTGIFAYTCGGAHLFQAAVALVAAGGTEAERAAVAEAGATWRWRLPEELALTDRVRAAHPEAAGALLVQRLKLIGHGLESLHRLAAARLLVGDPALPEVVRLEAELAKTASWLEEGGVWSALAAGRREGRPLRQDELDLLGDTSHAVHALRLGAGSAQIPW